MYNKLKHAFGMTAAIMAIVIGFFEVFIGAIYCLTGIIELLFGVVSLALGVLLIVFGAKGCRKPILVDGVYRKKGGVRLIVLLGMVFLGGIISFVSPILLRFFYEDIEFIIIRGRGIDLNLITYLLRLLNTFLAFIALPFAIVALCLKERSVVAEQPISAAENVVERIHTPVVEAKTPVAEAPKTALSIEGKIAELKRAKELGVISAEQYDAAVAQMIADFVK